MLNRSVVNVIGCGYGGIEAALFLAGHGIKVHVFSHEKFYKENAQIEENKTASQQLYESLLEKELALLGSPLIRKKQQLSADGVTSCLDELLLSYGLNMIKNNENIEFFDASISTLSPNEISIIASGPRTDKELFDYLTAKFGSLKCLQALPIFPVIKGIDISKLYQKSEDEFLLPLDEKQYLFLVNRIKLYVMHEKTEDKNFQILPNTIEDLALHHRENLRTYSMMPQMMEGRERPYATICIKRKREGFILPNISSSLPQFSQGEILRTLCGLENFEFVRPAGVNKGSYINPVHVVNEFCQSRQEPVIFFAGGIMGMGGHLNCIASGLYTAMNVYKYIQDKQMIGMSEDAALGKFIKKLTKENITKPRPLIISEEILEDVEEEDLEKISAKCLEKSLAALEKFKEEYKNGKYV